MARTHKNIDQQKILTPEQKRLLDAVSAEPYLCQHFYFTGGTPLSVFYLQHRLSEDIDLFSEKEIYLPSIQIFIKKIQKKFLISSIDYTRFLGLHSFQLTFPNQITLKVDFNYYPFPRIEKGGSYRNIAVDSTLDIAVNKVHTIAMKPRARDFIDIYFLVKEKGYGFGDLLMKAKAKFDWHIDPIHLGSRLLMAKNVKDFPKMIKKIDDREWQNFFIEEARKLKPEIIG